MIDRKLYQGSFVKDDIPSWICPTCNSSVLKLAEGKDFLLKHDSMTEQFKQEDWFDVVEHWTYTFTSILTCSNDKCKEVVTCSGTGFVEQDYYTNQDGQPDWKYIEYFKPKFFYPALHFFKIPENTPEDVSKAILESFSLFFTNKSSSANQIRIALECLLTHLKIKRFNIRAGRSRQRLNLHERINLLPNKYQDIKDLCFAIKWLGNSGSHSSEALSSNNIFDGYDMLSVLLEELYHNKQEHAKKLAKKINTRKGV